MVSHLSMGKINHRYCQLLETLHIPQEFALESTKDPESLKEILRRQYQSKGLTIVSDEVFTFFKVLYCKLKLLQTFKNLEHNKINLLQVTVLQLQHMLTFWIYGVTYFTKLNRIALNVNQHVMLKSMTTPTWNMN